MSIRGDWPEVKGEVSLLRSTATEALIQLLLQLFAYRLCLNFCIERFRFSSREDFLRNGKQLVISRTIVVVFVKDVGSRA